MKSTWSGLGVIGVLVITLGCAPPIHQKHTAESFSKSFNSMADLLQYELPSMVESVVLLSITNLALNPERKLEGQELLIKNELEEYSRKSASFAKWLRILGEVPPAILSEDRNRYAEIVTQLLSGLPEIYGGKDKIPDGAEDRMKITLAVMKGASNKDLILDMYNQPEVMFKAFQDHSELLKKILGYYKSKAKEVRETALTVLSDPKTSLENRLDVVNRYRVTLEGPRIADSLVNKFDAVTHSIIRTTTEMLKAMEKDEYTSEDLVALKERLDEFTKLVAEIVSLSRRLSGLFIF